MISLTSLSFIQGSALTAMQASSLPSSQWFRSSHPDLDPEIDFNRNNFYSTCKVERNDFHMRHKLDILDKGLVLIVLVTWWLLAIGILIPSWPGLPIFSPQVNFSFVSLVIKLIWMWGQPVSGHGGGHSVIVWTPGPGATHGPVGELWQ